MLLVRRFDGRDVPSVGKVIDKHVGFQLEEGVLGRVSRYGGLGIMYHYSFPHTYRCQGQRQIHK